VTAPPDPRPEQAATHPAFTHADRRRVPRWGSVADPGVAGVRRSTAPGAIASSTAASRPTTRPPPTLSGTPASQSTVRRLVAPDRPGSQAPAPRPTAPWAATAVVAGGLAFLVARVAVGGLPYAAPLLAVGYLALAGAALGVGERWTDRGATRGPLGWKMPLVLGLGGVVGAGIVAGPVADRRVGGVAVGLALLAAVAEEALFRRVLYDRLLRFGVVVAVAGSAVLFALVHLPAYGLAAMPVDLGAALLLGWQRYASGRWTVPAVTHAVANLLAVT
jgi:membrane protease YdiL (CAAX protease family)